MAGEINKLIPLYGELNRIYNDWITNYAFSFDKQKFITDFYRQHNDTKAFESAILELVLDKQKEQYTLILNSLKIEIEKNIRAYETKPLNDDIIKRVCFHQYSTQDLDNLFCIPINKDELGSDNEKCIFSIQPLTSMYQYYLINDRTGDMWKFQWSTKGDDYRWIEKFK